MDEKVIFWSTVGEAGVDVGSVTEVLAWMTDTSAEPWMELVTVSVAVTIWLGTVTSVTPFVKVCDPWSAATKV